MTDAITANGHAVQPANLNCPGQIVISGTKAGVEKACVQLKEAGARRAIPLDVSGPFHSSLNETCSGTTCVIHSMRYKWMMPLYRLLRT